MTHVDAPGSSSSQATTRRRWLVWLWRIPLLLLLVLGVVLGVFLASPSLQDMFLQRAAKARLAPHYLSLFEKDKLNLLLCGTGTPIASRHRAGPCAAILADGKFFLFDIGPSAWRNIALWQLPTERLSGVFFTHYHSDHIGGLGEASMQSWLAGRREALPVYGPPGVRRLVKGFQLAYASDRGYRNRHHGHGAMPLSGAKMKAQPFAIPDGMKPRIVWQQNGLRISAFSVRHSAYPSVGYRIDYRGRSVVISGDTIATEVVSRVAKGADLLVHEAFGSHLIDVGRKAALANNNKRLARLTKDAIEDHTTPVQAARIANAAGVRLLVYTHLVPAPDGFLRSWLFFRGVSAVRPSRWVVGEDGMVFSLPAKSQAIQRSQLRDSR